MSLSEVGAVKTSRSDSPANTSTAQEKSSKDEVVIIVGPGKTFSELMERIRREDPKAAAFIDTYHISDEDIARYNGINPETFTIMEGQIIRIPLTLEKLGVPKEMRAQHLQNKSIAELIKMARGNETINNVLDNPDVKLYFDPPTRLQAETFAAKEILKALTYKVALFYAQDPSFYEETSTSYSEGGWPDYKKRYEKITLDKSGLGYMGSAFKNSLKFILDRASLHHGISFDRQENIMGAQTLKAIFTVAEETVKHETEFAELMQTTNPSAKIAKLGWEKYFSAPPEGEIQVKTLSIQDLMAICTKIEKFVNPAASKPYPPKIIINTRQQFIHPLQKALKEYVAEQLEKNQFLKHKIAVGKSLVPEDDEGLWITNSAGREELVVLIQTALLLTGYLNYSNYINEFGRYERNKIFKAEVKNTKTFSALKSLQKEIGIPQEQIGRFGEKSLSAITSALRK